MSAEYEQLFSLEFATRQSDLVKTITKGDPNLLIHNDGSYASEVFYRTVRNRDLLITADHGDFGGFGYRAIAFYHDFREGFIDGFGRILGVHSPNYLFVSMHVDEQTLEAVQRVKWFDPMTHFYFDELGNHGMGVKLPPHFPDSRPILSSNEHGKFVAASMQPEHFELVDVAMAVLERKHRAA